MPDEKIEEKSQSERSQKSARSRRTLEAKGNRNEDATSIKNQDGTSNRNAEEAALDAPADNADRTTESTNRPRRPKRSRNLKRSASKGMMSPKRSPSFERGSDIQAAPEDDNKSENKVGSEYGNVRSTIRQST